MGLQSSSRPLRPSLPSGASPHVDPTEVSAFDQVRRAAATGLEGSKESHPRRGDATCAAGQIHQDVSPSAHPPTPMQERDGLRNQRTPRRPYVSFGQRPPAEDAVRHGDGAGGRAATQADREGRILADGTFVPQADIDHVSRLRDENRALRDASNALTPYGVALGMPARQGASYSLSPAGQGFILHERDRIIRIKKKFAMYAMIAATKIPPLQIATVLNGQVTAETIAAPGQRSAEEPSSRRSTPTPSRSYVEFGQAAPVQDSAPPVSAPAPAAEPDVRAPRDETMADAAPADHRGDVGEDRLGVPLSIEHVGMRLDEADDAELMRQVSGLQEPDWLMKRYANPLTDQGVLLDGVFTDVVRTGPDNARVVTRNLAGAILENGNRSQAQFTPVLRNWTFGGVSPPVGDWTTGSDPMEGLVPTPTSVPSGPDPIAASHGATDGVEDARERGDPADHVAPWSSARVGQRTKEAETPELNRRANGRPEPEGSWKVFVDGNVKTLFRVLKVGSEASVRTFLTDARGTSHLESTQSVSAEALTPELREIVFGPSQVEPRVPLLSLDALGVYSYDENGIGRFYDMFKLTATTLVVREPFQTVEVFVEHVNGSRLPGYLVTADQMEPSLRDVVFGQRPPA